MNPSTSMYGKALFNAGFCRQTDSVSPGPQTSSCTHRPSAVVRGELVTSDEDLQSMDKPNNAVVSGLISGLGSFASLSAPLRTREPQERPRESV